MKTLNKFIFLSLLVLLTYLNLISQVENVPVTNSVYDFLKRMEVKGIIDDYYDAVLPLSRKKIVELIKVISDKKDQLSVTENKILGDLLIEFEYDLKNTNYTSFNLLGKNDDVVSGLIRGTFQEREKYLYIYKDENVNLFLNGLFNIDFRRFTGTPFTDNVSFVEGGFRIRGSIYEKFGYYLNLTNAQFWGNRNVLMMDKRIKQSYALATVETKNFDFLDGYMRFQSGIISAQIGRERILWGNSYGDKLYISDYARTFDAIRIDLEYKFLKYTHLHGWLNGKKNFIYIPQTNDYEPFAADKFLAAHRLDISFTKFIRFGVQEFEIYSNRSVDLGYLNPVSFFESVQRARGERDNGFLGFDLKITPVKNLQLHAEIFFDDIEIPMWGKNKWDNKYAFQLGLLTIDPFGIPNLDFIAEYTRVDPYVFSHNRSRENSYSNENVLLGTQIGPNAESWYFKINNYLTNRFIISTSYEYQRSGENVYDTNGNLIKNVGGDFLQPLRTGIDEIPTKFLDGIIKKTHNFEANASYEFINEFYLNFWYKYFESRFKNLSGKTNYHNYGISFKIDF